MPKKRRKSAENVVAGFAWYKADEWQAWRAICPDFEPTHAEWQRDALKTILEMQRSGLQVKKVTLDVESFLLWCSQQGRERNSESRAEYVTHLLQQSND